MGDPRQIRDSTGIQIGRKNKQYILKSPRFTKIVNNILILVNQGQEGSAASRGSQGPTVRSGADEGLAGVAEESPSQMLEKIRERGLTFKSLYVEWKEKGRHEDAAELVSACLREAAEDIRRGARGRGIAKESDIVVAALELSPGDVTGCIDEMLKQDKDVAIRLVADLLAGAPYGADRLAQYAGSSKNWESYDAVQLCLALKNRSRYSYETVRSSMAARDDAKELAAVIQDWKKVIPSKKELVNLLADIMTSGTAGGGPREIAFLDDLATQSRLRHDAKLVSRLRVTAAKKIADRQGWEIAWLLGVVPGRRNQWKTAMIVNQILVEHLRCKVLETDKYIEYVRWLRKDQRRASDLIFWAMRAFSDPARSDWTEIAPVAAEIAARLYLESRKPEEENEPYQLDRAAFELLERFLGNEQKTRPDAARQIVEWVG
jgi:hypothetical protein